MSFCLSALSVLLFLMKYFTAFSCVTRMLEVCGLVAVGGVEEHRGIGGNIISRLDYGDFVGLIYSLLVFF